MKISKLDARPGSIFKLFHDRAARPEVREARGDHIGDGETGNQGGADDQCQPVLQSEFSLRCAHDSRVR